jgi:3-deoxy-7-phosphoheptulonate synthase
MPNPEHEPKLISSELMTSSYTTDYQPRYGDAAALDEAIVELENTTPVTTYENITALRSELEHIANGENNTPIIMAGPCAEHVKIEESTEEIARGYTLLLDSIESVNPSRNILPIIRGCGQSAKPRSSEFETVNGKRYLSYYGDMINGETLRERDPEPSRMVASALQARDVQAYLTEKRGKHVLTAHEALLLPYEHSFIRKAADGAQFLASADMPWIGERTRGPDGKHVKLLSNVMNPVAVKIGPQASSEDIVALAEALNPYNEPGKLTFILRLGVQHLNKAASLIDAITRFAPKSLLISDPMHGNTRKLAGGIKTRYIGDITDEVNAVADICKEKGVKLHGLHLEAVPIPHRECIGSLNEVPTIGKKVKVDPQLNLTQLDAVLLRTLHRVNQ